VSNRCTAPLLVLCTVHRPVLLYTPDGLIRLIAIAHQPRKERKTTYAEQRETSRPTPAYASPGTRRGQHHTYASQPQCRAPTSTFSCLTLLGGGPHRSYRTAVSAPALCFCYRPPTPARSSTHTTTATFPLHSRSRRSTNIRAVHAPHSHPRQLECCSSICSSFSST
jgi:hypothetical protein